MRYIALLRGINLGGNNQMKMSDLKAVLAGCGFENVVSYINSGNFAFDTKKTAESKLVNRIEDAVEAKFGKRVHVMVRPQSEMASIIRNNPFEGEFESHKHMHVLFLKSELPLVKQFQLSETDFEGESVVCLGREIYVLMPAGVAESVFSRKAVLDRSPRVPYTARNWRTVLKLADL